MRDPALDLLRSVALVRVALWHAFAASWMTFFAAMPMLFFVAGALLAASCETRSRRTVLWRRCRRLRPPLWVYGTVVAVAGAVRSGSDTGLGPPTSGSLRAYLWLLLLAPVLVVLARHLRTALPLLGLGVVALDVAAHHALPVQNSGHGGLYHFADGFTLGVRWSPPP